MMKKYLAPFSIATLLLGGVVIPAPAQQVPAERAPVAAAGQRATAVDHAAARRHIVQGDDMLLSGADWTTGITEYRMALSFDPSSAETHYKLAVALQHSKCIDESVSEYQQAIKLDTPNPNAPAQHLVQTADAYRQLGNICRDRKQLISAAANYKASLILEPNDVQTRESLADVLYSRELYAASAAEYRSVLQLAPKISSANLSVLHSNYGSCLDQLKQYTTAIAEYRAAVRLTPSDDASHYDLACELGLVARYPECIQECREAIRLNPSEARNRDEVGVLLYRNGQRKEARLEWRRVLQMGDADEAVAACKELADYGP